MSPLDDLFAKLAEEPIPGGCDQCHATQTLETVSPGMHVMHILHEDDCPEMRARKAGSN